MYSSSSKGIVSQALTGAGTEFKRLAELIVRRHEALVARRPRGVVQMSFSCVEAWVRASAARLEAGSARPAQT